MGKLPEGARRIDRGTRYGNPYPVAEYGREECLRLYRGWLEDKLREAPDYLLPLVGYNLACSCKPGDECHGDIILEKIGKLYRQE